MRCERRYEGRLGDEHKTRLRRSVIEHRPPLTNRGGGEPISDMAFAPRSRMVPPPRSFAADAHDCIMVPIRLGSTEYKFVARSRRQWRAPLGSSSRMQTVTKSRLPPVDMWTIGFADRLRFPRFPSKLEKRGNARLRPHTHRPRQQAESIIYDSKNHTRPAERTNGVHVKSVDTA